VHRSLLEQREDRHGDGAAASPTGTAPGAVAVGATAPAMVVMMMMCDDVVHVTSVDPISYVEITIHRYLLRCNCYVPGMAAERDLERLVTGLAPTRRPGRFVFVTLDRFRPELGPAATVVEAEGVTHVITQATADGAALPYDFVAAWITLEVHSALDAVGLTAVVATALARAGISCNVIAATHHDHLLVPIDRVDEAIEVLAALGRD
jgi:hypothetical protein